MTRHPRWQYVCFALVLAIMFLSGVVLRQQRAGEESFGRVEFTHREFNALVDWWNRDQSARG